MRIEDLDTVVTREELALVLRLKSARSLEKYVTAERRLGRAILPPPVGRARYLRVDVEKWLRQGGLSLAATMLRQARLRVIKGR